MDSRQQQAARYATPNLLVKPVPFGARRSREIRDVGIKGFMILLEGINPGTSKISNTLPYADYSNVKPLEVYISVLANIIIEPSEATILNKDSISFRYRGGQFAR
ncbi:Hypothetical predicted protein [Drosophila guanche]|uniref:Uncharacterized protein n=1 Tax=Drosophila guanche TaxID=7266 RepID=A0A3B0K4P9_DROGU|nr:Hypothetical predicted protein [Drosophila guanche]